jgi:two-component sensor histidine kinase
MKNVLGILLLVAVSFNVYGKKQGMALADSLLSVLSSANVKEDTVKVRLLGQLVGCMYGNGSNEMMQYARRELSLSDQLNYQAGIASGYFDIGLAYVELNKQSEALQNFNAALEINRSINNKTGVAGCSNRIGWLYYLQGDFVAALQNYLVAEKIFEEAGNKTGMAECYENVGLVYKAQANYTEAMKNYLQAIIIFEQEDDKKNIAGCSNSIGDIYEAQGNYPAAVANYRKALAALEAIGDKKGLMWPYYNIGEVYMLQGQYANALLYIDSALRINVVSGNKIGIAWCYNEMGVVYLKDKKYKDAEAYCIKALAIGTELKEASSFANASKNLSLIYKATGDFEKAMHYYEAYVNSRDSVSNNDDRLKTAALETRREAELKERQMKINEFSVKEKQNERIIFAAGIALLALSTAFVYRNYKLQKKTNAAQGALLAQKEMLMKEIHHRVKNNLQVISTLLDLQMNTTNDVDAKKAITESTVRVKAISLLHQQLYQNEDISSIEFSRFATDLYEQVSAILAGNISVALHNNIPHTILDIDTAVPLGLMINELLTNSYKYAFGSGSGSITITLELSANWYVLYYKDSGPGMQAGQDVQKTKSLGMTLLRSLNKQIGGTLQYDPAARTFIIPFKDTAGMKLTE